MSDGNFGGSGLEPLDESNAPGQFILSGSTRFLTIPTLSESLAGRAGFVELWPLAVAERAGVTADLARILTETPRDLLAADASPWSRANYLDLIVGGGFPEAIRLPEGQVRRAWFEGYVQTVIQRDVRQFADIRHGSVVPRLLALLAARAGGQLIANDLARVVELGQPTVRDYLSYLDMVFLTTQIPGWATGLTTKAAKNPKTYLTDTGVAAHLMNADVDTLREPGHPALGPLVETFVVTELLKLFADDDRGLVIQYFRDRDGREIDVILESRDGRVTAIEVKALATASAKDFRHLTWLRDKLGDRFIAGIVCNLVAESLSFGDRLMAVPVSALWQHAGARDLNVTAIQPN